MSRFVFLILLLCSLHAPQGDCQDNIPLPGCTLELVFAGDIMGHDSQILSSLDPGTGMYDYDSCFSYVKKSFEGADYVAGNLEVTLAGEPYKGYPQFSSPDALALALKKAGFNVLIQANNHACDRGNDGLMRTLEVLDMMEIQHTGTFRDSADRERNHPLLLEKNGFLLALLNYTYGTNGLEVPEPAIVNTIDRIQIRADLETAREAVPDMIIVCMHWGTEYESLPNEEQRSLAQFLFREGADIIIGSHPHVIHPMEFIRGEGDSKDRLLVYSLGNFVSNQRNRGTDGGAMVRIRLEKDSTGCSITRAGYLLNWVFTPVVNGKKEFYVLPSSLFQTEADPVTSKEDRAARDLFLNDSRTLFEEYNRGVGEWGSSAPGNPDQKGNTNPAQNKMDQDVNKHR